MARHQNTQRRRALDVIFEAEQKDILVPGLLRELLAERRKVSTAQVPIQDLGAELVELVATHLYEVDEMIDNYSKWGLRRLSSLDRAVLRLGLAELCFNDAEISKVVFEYSAIVRELGNEKSIGFITAIFNRAKKESGLEQQVSDIVSPATERETNTDDVFHSTSGFSAYSAFTSGTPDSAVSPDQD